MVLTRSQEEEYLHRYDAVVQRSLGKYFLRGAERADLLQVGRIALVIAMRDYSGHYKTDFDPHFQNFAKLVVSRAVISEVKRYDRLKNRALNESCSTTASGEEGDLCEYSLAFVDERYSPERIVLGERLDVQQDAILLRGRRLMLDKLSPFEKKVLLLRAETCGEKGASYVVIAQRLNVPFKAVDNALQRIKRKLKPLYKECSKIDSSYLTA